MLSSNITALIIKAVTVVLYATEKIPMAEHCCPCCPMAFTGCISFSEAFAGFSNTALVMRPHF